MAGSKSAAFWYAGRSSQAAPLFAMHVAKSDATAFPERARSVGFFCRFRWRRRFGACTGTYTSRKRGSRSATQIMATQ
jgi:hypothetical protein